MTLLEFTFAGSSQSEASMSITSVATGTPVRRAESRCERRLRTSDARIGGSGAVDAAIGYCRVVRFQVAGNAIPASKIFATSKAMNGMNPTLIAAEIEVIEGTECMSHGTPNA